MSLLVAFAATLVVAVLLSRLASRSVLSTAVLFLAVGIALGFAGAGPPGPDEPAVELVAELALVAVLYTDGMLAGSRDLTSAWRLPGRALLIGMPLTLAVTAGLAWLLLPLSVSESLLLGAALAPTDPVFASALVGRRGIPDRLRRLLNVESGINDGLALPVVLVLLSFVGAEADIGAAFTELVVGLVVGVGIPLAIVGLERSRFFAARGVYEPLTGFAVGLLVYAVGRATHANLFLAAFAAGVTVASLSPSTREAFHEFGEIVSELLKLAALLAFGTLITPELLGRFGWAEAAFVVAAIIVARPVALGIALTGSSLSKRGLAAAAWFGPKGFASVVYGLLIAGARFDNAEYVFTLIAGVCVVSIVAHSSTDVAVANRLATDAETQPADSASAGATGDGSSEPSG